MNAKHRQHWKNTPGDLCLPGDLFVGIVMVLEPVLNEKRETARRILGRFEHVLNFARRAATATATIRRGGPGHLRDLLLSNGKTVEHHAVLPCVELPAFIADLREREGIAARAPEFTILTAARTGEVIGASWSEIDFKGRSGLFPHRMKPSRSRSIDCAGSGCLTQRKRSCPCVIVGSTTSWD
jgi:hypothetical protein